MVDKIYNFLENRFLEQQTITEGGALRSFSGETVELLIDYVWNELLKKYSRNGNSKIGSKDSFTIHSKSGEIEESVDRHLYLDGKCVCIIECKTYLDKCYMQRASSDFELIKKEYPDTYGIIVSLEDSIATNAYNFWMEEGFINQTFIFADGKRNSRADKRIYFTYKNRLNREKIQKFVDFMEGFFNENQY